MSLKQIELKNLLEASDYLAGKLHATNGFKGAKGTMPPKGDNPGLSDADIKAAVQYMLDAAK